MKILATFDGSKLSEATLPTLTMIAQLPAAELTFLAIAGEPHGRIQRPGGGPPGAMAAVAGSTPVVIGAPDPVFAENKGQAIERQRAEFGDYLRDLAAQLPPRTRVDIVTEVSDDAADAIIACAKERGADVIVMATRSRTGLAHALFGSTTEKVVRSGVAPVLLVHPKDDGGGG